MMPRNGRKEQIKIHIFCNYRYSIDANIHVETLSFFIDDVWSSSGVLIGSFTKCINKALSENIPDPRCPIIFNPRLGRTFFFFFFLDKSWFRVAQWKAKKFSAINLPAKFYYSDTLHQYIDGSCVSVRAIRLLRQSKCSEYTLEWFIDILSVHRRRGGANGWRVGCGSVGSDWTRAASQRHRHRSAHCLGITKLWCLEFPDNDSQPEHARIEPPINYPPDALRETEFLGIPQLWWSNSSRDRIAILFLILAMESYFLTI